MAPPSAVFTILILVYCTGLASVFGAFQDRTPPNPTSKTPPMPGKVSAVSVSLGQDVRKGARLLAIEAMKMETAIYAPRDGKIVKIDVQPGNLVAAVHDFGLTEHIEESTAMRKLLRMGYDVYVAEEYRAGRLSLREAASRMGMSLSDALDALQPVIDAQTAVVKLDWNIAESKKAEAAAAADEARDRDNLTALKGNEAAKRFVDELNHAEDTLQAARKQTADLEQQKQTAVAKLNTLIASLNFDWDVTAEK